MIFLLNSRPPILLPQEAQCGWVTVKRVHVFTSLTRCLTYAAFYACKLPPLVDAAVALPASIARMVDAGSSRDEATSRQPPLLPGAAAGAAAGAATGAAADEAALDRLVERAVEADSSGRTSFAASLWERAAAAATAIHGGASLVAARCTLEQAASLSSQAGAEASLVERAALLTKAWALVSSVLPLLTNRMNDNTLLPGRCTKGEVDFLMHFSVSNVVCFKKLRFRLVNCS